MRLRARGIPLALHADLGNDAAPTRYLPLMEEVLCLYPENVIVWVHMGLSRELTAMAAAQHMLAGNWKPPAWSLTTRRARPPNAGPSESICSRGLLAS